MSLRHRPGKKSAHSQRSDNSGRIAVPLALLLALGVAAPVVAKPTAAAVKAAAKHILKRVVIGGGAIGAAITLADLSFVYVTAQAPSGGEVSDWGIMLDGSLVSRDTGPLAGTWMGQATTAQAEATARTGGWIFGPEALRRANASCSGPDAFANAYAKAGVKLETDAASPAPSGNTATVTAEIDLSVMEFTLTPGTPEYVPLGQMRITDLETTEVSDEFGVPASVLSSAGLTSKTPNTTYLSVDLGMDAGNNLIVNTSGIGTLDSPITAADFTQTLNGNEITIQYTGGLRELDIVVPHQTPVDLSVETYGQVETEGGTTVPLLDDIGRILLLALLAFAGVHMLRRGSSSSVPTAA